jgi:hypothetical protein
LDDAVGEVGLEWQLGPADGQAGVDVGHLPGAGLVERFEGEDAHVAEQLDAVAAGA